MTLHKTVILRFMMKCRLKIWGDEWNNVLSVDFGLISNLGPTDEVNRLEAGDPPTKIIDKVLDELRWVIKKAYRILEETINLIMCHF